MLNAVWPKPNDGNGASRRVPWHPSAAHRDPCTAGACPRSRSHPGHRRNFQSPAAVPLTIGPLGTPGTPLRRAATLAARRVSPSAPDVLSIRTGNGRFFQSFRPRAATSRSRAAVDQGRGLKISARAVLSGRTGSMPQDFEQFPTTGGDIEEPSCGRPRPRAALLASQSASIGSLLRQARWCCIWSIKKGGRVILLAWPDFSNFTTAEVKPTISSLSC